MIIRNYTINGKITIKMHMIIDISFVLKKDTSTRVQIINQKMKSFADKIYKLQTFFFVMGIAIQ
jgi:hypothetical protein